MMMGVWVHSRRRRVTSTPSRSGSPRSSRNAAIAPPAGTNMNGEHPDHEPLRKFEKLAPCRHGRGRFNPGPDPSLASTTERRDTRGARQGFDAFEQRVNMHLGNLPSPRVDPAADLIDAMALDLDLGLGGRHCRRIDLRGG